jgi:hypothetical protein
VVKHPNLNYEVHRFDAIIDASEKARHRSHHPAPPVLILSMRFAVSVSVRAPPPCLESASSWSHGLRLRAESLWKTTLLLELLGASTFVSMRMDLTQFLLSRATSMHCFGRR